VVVEQYGSVLLPGDTQGGDRGGLRTQLPGQVADTGEASLDDAVGIPFRPATGAVGGRGDVRRVGLSRAGHNPTRVGIKRDCRELGGPQVNSQKQRHGAVWLERCV